MNHVCKYSIYLLLSLLTACVSKREPNTTRINRLLGIVIPEYHLTQSSADPFGVGLDEKVEYLFQFDSANFALLERRICHSFLYNVASKAAFDRMALKRRIDLLRSLSEHGITAYWIKSGDTFLFDADSTLHNPADNVYQYLLANHIFFPNQDSTRVWQGMAATMYIVKSVVDAEKRTLFFQYTHI